MRLAVRKANYFEIRGKALTKRFARCLLAAEDTAVSMLGTTRRLGSAAKFATGSTVTQVNQSMGIVRAEQDLQ